MDNSIHDGNWHRSLSQKVQVSTSSYQSKRSRDGYPLQGDLSDGHVHGMYRDPLNAVSFNAADAPECVYVCAQSLTSDEKDAEWGGQCTDGSAPG